MNMNLKFEMLKMNIKILFYKKQIKNEILKLCLN